MIFYTGTPTPVSDADNVAYDTRGEHDKPETI